MLQTQMFRLFQEASTEELRRIFRSSLGEERVWTASLLEGGLFNTTYHVVYGVERREAVLRLGPVNRALLMGHEENLMQAEAEVCRLCAAHEIPSYRVLAVDSSKTVVDRDYMIVEYIPSVAMNQIKLTEAERASLYRQIGAYLRRFHQIKGESFGYLSRILRGEGFSTWGDALLFEVEDILGRLERYLGCSGREIRKAFHRNKALLDMAGPACLLHTDMWEGNVLLDRETHEILAVIDGDRAVYGDPDFEFSSSWMEDPDLLDGYGLDLQEKRRPEREKRRVLYRLYYLLLESYVEFEKYESRGRYDREVPQIRSLLRQVDRT